MKRQYRKRIKYGIHYAIIDGTTISGLFLSFTDGSIGSDHWYKKISFLEYLICGNWYKLLERFLPKYYKKLVNKTW